MLAKQHAERFPVRNFTVRVKTYSKYKQSTVLFFFRNDYFVVGVISNQQIAKK